MVVNSSKGTRIQLTPPVFICSFAVTWKRASMHWFCSRFWPCKRFGCVSPLSVSHTLRTWTRPKSNLPLLLSQNSHPSVQNQTQQLFVDDSSGCCVTRRPLCVWTSSLYGRVDIFWPWGRWLVICGRQNDPQMHNSGLPKSFCCRVRRTPVPFGIASCSPHSCRSALWISFTAERVERVLHCRHFIAVDDTMTRTPWRHISVQSLNAPQQSESKACNFYSSVDFF